MVWIFTAVFDSRNHRGTNFGNIDYPGICDESGVEYGNAAAYCYCGCFWRRKFLQLGEKDKKYGGGLNRN